MKYHDEDFEQCPSTWCALKMLAITAIHSFLKNRVLVPTSCTELIDRRMDKTHVVSVPLEQRTPCLSSQRRT